MVPGKHVPRLCLKRQPEHDGVEELRGECPVRRADEDR